MRFVHHGQCHCGSIAVELRTARAPEAQVLGACQCSFCRKHNVRAFSDPGSRVTLRAVDFANVRLYRFGLATVDVVLCRMCGVYVAMLLIGADGVRSVINVDALDERARFVATPTPRDYSAETAQERVARRRARWTPTTLLDWPAVPASGRTTIENELETDGGRHG